MRKIRPKTQPNRQLSNKHRPATKILTTKYPADPSNHINHEKLTTREKSGLVTIGRALVGSVWFHVPGLGHVGKVDGKHLVTEKPHQFGILHRKGHFHPAIEVARHHVRAAEIHFLLPGIAEIENAAVLKESTDIKVRQTSFTIRQDAAFALTVGKNRFPLKL